MSNEATSVMLRTEVLVVGAGPAGIAAATAAATHGRKVIVLDDNASAGGQIWRSGPPNAASQRDTQKDKALQAFQNSGAELLAGRRIVDAPRQGFLRAVVETASAFTAETFVFEHLVLATGARERLLPFPGWTLDGVFGAGGLQALAKGGYDVAGKRVIVAGTGPLLLAVAAHLREYGAIVVCVAEQASRFQMLPLAISLFGHPGKLMQGIGFRSTLKGVPYRTGCWPVAATGDPSLKAVRLTDGSRVWDEPCDLLGCGFHLAPNNELAALLGCDLNGGFVRVDAHQRSSISYIFAAGETTGIAGLDAATIEGTIAGLSIAGHLGKAAQLFPERDHERRFREQLDKAFRLRPELRNLAVADTIVCRCEDVRHAELATCHSWTQAKLQTRCGMGPCQGRICGPAVETIFGWTPTSIRPPLSPIPLGLFLEDSATDDSAQLHHDTNL
jgi:NADPH-dependent 2,4-dienoyl-CoA reductase/sulfur reductase-like enzyme